MVHLNNIANPEEVEQHLVQAVKKFHLDLADNEDSFTTSVYGSKFARADLPRHEMPEGEMPREVAYRMIKDELSLDGNPMLKSVLITVQSNFSPFKLTLYSSIVLPPSSLHTWYVDHLPKYPRQR